jgi:hypothetical protein
VSFPSQPASLSIGKSMLALRRNFMFHRMESFTRTAILAWLMQIAFTAHTATNAFYRDGKAKIF